MRYEAAVFFRRCALVIGLCFSLTGCDEVAAIQKRLSDLGQQIEDLVKEITALSARVTALEQQKQTDARSFDGCVLQNMKGVNSDLAAASIKESCLRTVSVPLTDLNGLTKSTAVYGQIHGSFGAHFGLYVTLNNNTGYTITELGITVENKKSGERKGYTLRSFSAPVPEGVMITGPPRDPTMKMQLLPGQRIFTLEIMEPVKDAKHFFDEYDWGILSAKGFVQ